jgi:hypothetical protein
LALIDWIKTESAQQWIKENKRVKEFLDSITNVGTKATYGQGLQQFCEYTKESPESLIQIRFSKDLAQLKEFREHHALPDPVTEDAEDGGRVMFELLKKFLTKGTVEDKRWWTKKKGRTIKIGALSKTRRMILDCAVRRYFRHFTGDLPHGDWKIEDYGRVPDHEEFDLENVLNGVREAREIIAQCREPYKTLFTASLYTPLGRDELVKLNDLWSAQIRPQLRSKQELIVLEYARRKKNPQPYKPIVPAFVFKSYRNAKGDRPFKNRGGSDVQHDDLNFIWQSARRRSNVGKKEVRQHDLRDLWETIADRAGVKESIIKFIMGHTVSKYNYNKIYRDVPLVKREYRKFLDYVDAGAAPIRRQDIAAEFLRESMLSAGVPEDEINKVDLTQPNARSVVKDIVLKKRQPEAPKPNGKIYEIVSSQAELVRKLNAGWQAVKKEDLPPNVEGFMIFREEPHEKKK